MKLLLTRRNGRSIVFARSSDGLWWGWLIGSPPTHGPASLSSAVAAACAHADRLPRTNHPATPWLPQIAAQGHSGQ